MSDMRQRTRGFWNKKSCMRLFQYKRCDAGEDVGGEGGSEGEFIVRLAINLVIS